MAEDRINLSEDKASEEITYAGFNKARRGFITRLMINRWIIVCLYHHEDHVFSFFGFNWIHEPYNPSFTAGQLT